MISSKVAIVLPQEAGLQSNACLMTLYNIIRNSVYYSMYCTH